MAQRGQRQPDLGIDGEDTLKAVKLSLDAMANGGIYDQIGGGFHRYTTDASGWCRTSRRCSTTTPCSPASISHAWQLTGDERSTRASCEETLDYVLREMTAPEGGFYSTPGRRQRRRGGEVLRLDAERIRTPCSATKTRNVAEQYCGVTAGRQLRGQQHPLSCR